MREYTLEEVRQHDSAESCWVVIDGSVYDVTSFQHIHPGSRVPLLQHAGRDCTQDFFGLHKRADLAKWHDKLCIGSVKAYTKDGPVGISRVSSLKAMPYGENFSLYQTPAHQAFRLEVRRIIHELLLPMVEEDNGRPVTKETLLKLGETGILACFMGPGEHLNMVPTLPGGLHPEEFDEFHETICQEEIALIGSLAVKDGVVGGLVVGLPLVLKFGSQELVQRIAPDVLNGRKQICLAITEPYVGSDVASLRTEAVRSECGQYYTVRGTKKWITQGLHADYFVTAVRTGGKGKAGISVLVIERDENVQTKLISTSYSPCAATAYVVFDDVRVSSSNRVGEENKGFKVVVSNFNHERFQMLCYHHRFARLCVEDAFKWACQRTVFGKQLIDQPVIQSKLANLIGQLEAVSAWIDQTTFRLQNGEDYDSLAGTIALLKLQQTRVAQQVSDQTVQILGGRGITKHGLGGNVERFLRSFKYGAVTGGSEEIMATLGMRQALRSLPKDDPLARL